MKARRRANVVDTDNDQDAEEQGRNLLEDLDFKAFETQVPPHLDSQGRLGDAQGSESVEEQMDILSTAKTLAEFARKRRSTEGI